MAVVGMVVSKPSPKKYRFAGRFILRQLQRPSEVNNTDIRAARF